MRNRAIEYPHPVLNEYTNDFTDCSFAIEVVSHSDTGNAITLELAYDLKCDGIIDLLSRGLAKIAVRLTCFRTSHRTVFDMNLKGTTIISIPKKSVTDVLDIQATIVATRDFDNYSLPEFNKNYFGSSSFSLRKGDIIANEPGLKIKLNTVLEKNMAGIVLINTDPTISEMKVSFASVEETDPALTNYIYITLPDAEYKNYAKLMTKKHLKNGIERFLQSSVVLPAITEAVAKLRMEEMLEDDGSEVHYSGTVWADSIRAALTGLGIDELSTNTQSDYEIANKLLGNVIFDSISNLMQKMIEWSTIRQEDDVL